MKRLEQIRRRGQILPLFAIFLGFLLGFAALAFDIGYAMVVRTQLMAALDAATLASIRYAPQGAAAMEAAAQRTFAANLPAGKLMISNPTVTTPALTEEQGALRVALSASADIPMFFARWFRADGMTIRANSAAARRDRNIILVLDYSASVGPVLGDIKDAAKAFVNSFSDQYDQVGLVVFSTSGAIAYPPQRPFKADLTGVINGVQQELFTNHAIGLYYAYRAMAELNDPLKDLKMNEIVLFTDGRANWFPGRFNVRTGSGRCNTSPAEGVFGITGRSYYNNRILSLQASAMPNAPALSPDCSGLATGTNPVLSINPSWIPPSSPTAGAIFPEGVSLLGFKNNSTTILNKSNPSTTEREQIAANVTDSLARLIRKDPMGIRLHAIGYEGTETLEMDVLERIANCQDCTRVDAADAADTTQAKGRLVMAQTQQELLQAFLDIAGFIGRITD
ncbi:MAG: VWA domain-containing protein [Acidobacteria bacterium]|nr:VWA domain-containing protein [Acidobacteriota bacterium]